MTICSLTLYVLTNATLFWKNTTWIWVVSVRNDGSASVSFNSNALTSASHPKMTWKGPREFAIYLRSYIEPHVGYWSSIQISIQVRKCCDIILLTIHYSENRTSMLRFSLKWHKASPFLLSSLIVVDFIDNLSRWEHVGLWKWHFCINNSWVDVNNSKTNE